MTRELAKDFHNLLRGIGKLSAGQASVSDWDSDDLTTFEVEIAPSGGLYHGGKFKFKFVIDDFYPEIVPSVICKTQIYHPNIDTIGDVDGDNTNICVSTLDEWDNGFLEDLVQALLFLFHNPNTLDPLCPLFSAETPVEEFQENVRLSLEGGEVEGHTFELNYGYLENKMVTEVNDISGLDVSDAGRNVGTENSTNELSDSDKTGKHTENVKTDQNLDNDCGASGIDHISIVQKEPVEETLNEDEQLNAINRISMGDRSETYQEKSQNEKIEINIENDKNDEGVSCTEDNRNWNSAENIDNETHFEDKQNEKTEIGFELRTKPVAEDTPEVEKIVFDKIIDSNEHRGSDANYNGNKIITKLTPYKSVPIRIYTLDITLFPYELFISLFFRYFIRRIYRCN